MTVNERPCAFGPVPSRRLGRSLGINNIPAKVCSYACVYCQLGRTTQLQIDRCVFYEPEAILRAVRGKLAAIQKSNQPVDYLAFVPDGDPTLDSNLGKTLAQVKTLAVPVGVITNSALMDRGDVRRELLQADWVSLKIDAVHDKVWRRINRPHKKLRLPAILAGMQAFADAFGCVLVTETMLVRGLNDTSECLAATAAFIRLLNPSVAYLSIPTRPPAEKWVCGPDAKRLNRAYQIFADRGLRVEYLIGYEGDTFAYSGDIEKDILSITAVHPMRKGALEALLSQAGANWTLVEQLLASGDLTEVTYENHRFFLRRIEH